MEKVQQLIQCHVQTTMVGSAVETRVPTLDVVVRSRWLFECRPRRGRPHGAVQPGALDVIQVLRHPVVAVGLPHLFEFCDNHVHWQKWQSHSLPTDAIDGVVGRALPEPQRPGYCATTPGRSGRRSLGDERQAAPY